MARKILTISTSADQLNGLKTGLWLEELAAPYYIWKEKGFDVVIGAVADKIPLDAASLAENMKGPFASKFLEDGITTCEWLPRYCAMLCWYYFKGGTSLWLGLRQRQLSAMTKCSTCSCQKPYQQHPN
jgi:hypothetical protein